MNIRRIDQSSVDSIYFLASARDNYFEGPLTIIFIFAMIKILEFLLYLLHMKNEMFTYFYKELM